MDDIPLKSIHIGIGNSVENLLNIFIHVFDVSFVYKGKSPHHSLNWQEFIKPLQYTSGVISENKIVIGLYGDVIIVINVILYIEVWV